MLKVLIVDDEVWMRRGIRSMLETSTYAIEEIEEASDAEQALKRIQRADYDVVFVDIRMPGSDGLTFIESAIAMSPLTSFIVVSGYSDFEYAKRAIHLKVVDYLLKPVVRSDLLTAFEKAIRTRQQDVASTAAPDQSQLVTSLKEKLVLDLIEGRSDATNQLARSLQSNMDKCHFACVSFSIQNTEAIVAAKGESEITLIYYIMNNFMVDIIGESLHGIVIQHQGGLHAILYNDYLQKDEMAAKVRAYTNRVFEWVKRLKFFSVHCGISLLHQQPAGIGFAFQEAVDALTYAKMFAPGVSEAVYAPDMAQHGHVGYSLDIEKQLYGQVALGSKEGISDIITLMLDKAFAVVRTPKALRQLLEMCWLLGERWLIENAGHTPLPLTYNEFVTNPMKYDSLAHIERALTNHYYTLSLAINKKTKTEGKKAIEEMMDYVQHHYNENISLTDLSARLYMNAAYLSDLFKDTAGMNFVSYVTSIRMKKACEYLKHREIKINQIATLVGFEDERYFSTVFKKTFGMTPREYRNQL